MKKIMTMGAVVAVAASMTACSGGGNSQATNSAAPNGQATALKQDGCTNLVVATSSEKVNFMSEAGDKFKNSPEAKGLKKCVTVYPINVTSGDAAKNLSSSTSKWPDDNKDFWPTMWSPASTIWTDRLNSSAGSQVADNVTSIAKSPVVLGMPESMAKALGYPNKKISLNDIEKIIRAKDGWGSVGKPLWGNFKIAKTNPNTSTTGLETIIMQSYAAVNKDKNLTTDDVAKAKDFNKIFESAAIHYGDTTGNVLTTLYNDSKNGTSSSYVSAVALEEASLVNYNKGNPDSHVVQPGEKLTPPKEKLVAIYPSGGSMVSDDPIANLNVDWATDDQKSAGAAFAKYLKSSAAQNLLGKYGFRSVDANTDESQQLNSSVGVDLKYPSKELPKPSAAVVSNIIDQWTNIRKPSAVMELIDISNSMKDDAGNGQSKIEGAIKGAQSTIGNFRNSDELGIWTFTTDISSKYGQNIVPLREFGSLNGDKETVSNSLNDLNNAKMGGTPLYDSISTTYDYMRKQAQSGRINAMVVLTDGDDTNSNTSLDSLLVKLRSANSEGSDNPVRIFTIAYGQEADKDALKKISDATGGQMFDSSDPTKIQKVFTSVINNF